MNIDFNTNTTSAIGYNKPLGNVGPYSRHPPACDRVQTSKEALLLSRNLASLKEELRPREEMLIRFSGSVETPLALDDQTLDRILGQL